MSILNQIGKTTRNGILASAILIAAWTTAKTTMAYANHVGTFDLKRIEVRGNDLLTRAEVVEAMALPLVGSVFDIDLRQLQARVEAVDYVYGVRVGRRFPNTLFVDLVENHPLAYVAAAEYFTMSYEGFALPLPHGRFEVELPTITGTDSVLACLEIGSVVDHPQLSQTWELLKFIYTNYPKIYREISELVYSDNNELTLLLAENSTAIKLGAANIQERIIILDAFINTLAGKRRLTDYTYIDLRYSKQIVVRERT